MRHRRPAQRRQVHPVQCPDQSRHRGRELPLLHHRAQRRHRRAARPAPCAAGADRQARAHRAGDRRVRRHRRTGGRRQPGRRPGQPVPEPHPRNRRHRQRGALLRGRQRHPRGRQGGPDRRHRGHPDRAVPGRPGHRGKEPGPLPEGGQGRAGQGGAAPGRGAEEVPGGAGPGAAGARHRLQQGRAGGAQAAVPDHRQAGDVRRQRGRGRLRATTPSWSSCAPMARSSMRRWSPSAPRPRPSWPT